MKKTKKILIPLFAITLTFMLSVFLIPKTKLVNADTYMQEYYFPFDYTLTQIDTNGNVLNVPTVKYYTDEFYAELEYSSPYYITNRVIWEKDNTLTDHNISFKRNPITTQNQNYKLEMNNFTLDKTVIDNYNIDIDINTDNYFFVYTIRYITAIEYDLYTRTTNITFDTYMGSVNFHLPIFSSFIQYLNSIDFATQFRYRTFVDGWTSININSNYIFIDNLSLEVDNTSKHDIVFISNMPRGITYNNLPIYYYANEIFKQLNNEINGDLYQYAYRDGYNTGEDIGFADGFAQGEQNGYDAWYPVGYDDGFAQGENVGYSNKGFIANSIDNLNALFSVNIFGDLTLGNFIFICFSVVAFFFLLKFIIR